MSTGLAGILIERLSLANGMSLAALAGTAFAWTVATAYLLVGAYSLRLIGPRPAPDRAPLWFTAPGFPMLVSCLVAVGEEVLFRGVLQSICLTLVGPVYAIFLVNALFALIHAKGGLTFAMSAGFFGTIASVITLASDSLLPAIAMHVGWNALVGLARRRAAAAPAA